MRYEEGLKCTNHRRNYRQIAFFVFFVRIEPFSSWRSHSVGFCDSGVQFLRHQPKKTGRNETKATKNARSKKIRSSQPLHERIGGRLKSEFFFTS